MKLKAFLVEIFELYSYIQCVHDIVDNFFFLRLIHRGACSR